MTAESQRNYNNKEGDEISLKELLLKIQAWWHYLLIKWKTILFFGLIGGVFGLTYAYFKKPIYTATTSFVLEDEKGTSGGLGSLVGLASMAGVDIGGSGGGIFQGDNILELYKSRTMIEKTLLTEVDKDGKKQLLIDCYIDFNELRDKWNLKPELRKIQFNLTPNQHFTRVQDSLLSTIINNINKNYLNVTKPDKKLNIIKADVKSENEFFSKSFNDEIVKNVNDFYIQTKTKKSFENVKILQQKTDSIRAVMNGAIYSAVAVADATPNLNPTRQIQRVAPAQRAQFSAEANKAILGALVQNLEMAKISLRKEAPLIQVIDSPIYPLEKKSASKIIFGIAFFMVFGVLISLFLISKELFRTVMR
ncbi:lipopolysaccharide biosynthesis protein [Pedobacter sp. MR2016-19]|uniref:Wzz/FepE/Etk N-terminal domain-containing protein n=1 Tax=Pedobacter sp. MR2016-19 TaxID=2780089 RepID=UPI00187572A7|nr:Wzz/FepE/Etk N-terminal domain-containing protein [Pedobacter sp. MR2016-19]MBE5322002.1 lipopolysaccharide biosynthesis protein [Pedobacter sp. MR2016-19]